MISMLKIQKKKKFVKYERFEVSGSVPLMITIIWLLKKRKSILKTENSENVFFLFTSLYAVEL